MSITLGILGFAHGHVGVYCDQWMKMPDHPIHIAAGWDHDAQRLAAAREKFNVDACDSPEALVRREDVQAVVIGGETSLHADLVETAADAGKSILLQKPLALTRGTSGRERG